MRLGRAVVGAVLLPLVAGTILPTCSTLSLDVKISASGVLNVVTTCEALRRICNDEDQTSCDPVFCKRSAACELRDPCVLSGHPLWKPSSVKGVKVVLFSTSPFVARAQTECVCVEVDDLQCADGGASSCASVGMNLKLAAAAPAGLSFGGFRSAQDGSLAIAFFQPSTAVGRCSDLGTGGADLCAEQNLVACAGLQSPLGGGNYDISCASCQGSIHQAFGPNTGPCDTAGTGCFLQTCDTAMFGTIDAGS